jgi:hypothetical protein
VVLPARIVFEISSVWPLVEEQCLAMVLAASLAGLQLSAEVFADLHEYFDVNPTS